MESHHPRRLWRSDRLSNGYKRFYIRGRCSLYGPLARNVSGSKTEHDGGCRCHPSSAGKERASFAPPNWQLFRHHPDRLPQRHKFHEILAHRGILERSLQSGRIHWLAIGERGHNQARRLVQWSVICFIRSHHSSPGSIPIFLTVAERSTELLPRAMKPRSNGIGRQLTGKRDLVVAQAADFAHQEDITIDGAQTTESFTQGHGQRLCGRQRWVGSNLDRLAPSSIVPHVIQREIPRDAKEPGTAAAFVAVRSSRTRHTKEHFLRQFARILVPDDAAEIAEDAVSMRGEEEVGVGHKVTLSTKDTAGHQSSQERKITLSRVHAC
jgi:hypothetical protein